MKLIKRILLVLGIIIVIILGVAVGYVYNKLSKINHVDISRGDVEVNSGVEEKLGKYRNIVIFGIDSLNNKYTESRTDCIIIASINNDTKEIKLVSVYRDTYLNIAGYGLDKVNHAYAYGGPALSISTLNTNLDLNITEFITVNFEATKDIIDAVGGVKINITDAEARSGSIPGITKAGTYTLNGEQALAYGRIRKIDNDYVRTERMRTVLTAVLNKAKTISLGKLNKLVDELLPQVYTNISATEIIAMLPQIYSCSIVQSDGWPYETRGITLDGVWYGPPVTLESNVSELHKELFGEDEYIPTEKVKEISKKIVNKTGYNK